MTEEDRFHLQHSKTIQAWLRIETELYLLYYLLMKGANAHLVSATFNNIQSLDAKLVLLKSCFTLVLPEKSDDMKTWKKLHKSVQTLNKKRNKVVHEPISIMVEKNLRTISISPSLFNSLAIVKGQTTNKQVVVSKDYSPSNAKLLEDHRIDYAGLEKLQQTFKSKAEELKEYREKISETVTLALKSASEGK